MTEQAIPSFNRISRTTELPPPSHLIRFFPIVGTPVDWFIAETRQRIVNILHGRDDRLLVVVGPCSIHDPHAAMEYAQRLAEQRTALSEHLEIVMRVYFEKPRTTVGWKGLINDPHLNGSFSIDEGLRMARQLLIEINQIGMPAGSEFLDLISPQYIGDLISWGAIGARTTESQVHRELASGLPVPIGFKNGTDGNLKVAIDAIVSASKSHSYLGVQDTGLASIIQTTGNPDCHIILRGGKYPNYGAGSIASAAAELQAANLPARLMVDCSHGNSVNQHERQLVVAADLANQIREGNTNIFGVMIESNLLPGSQKFTPGQDSIKALVRGLSITDACLGWESTVEALDLLAEAVATRRR